MTDDAIPAATLVVLRDRPGGAPDVLMVRRTQRMAFAAGAMVFPGGRVDEADFALASDRESAAKIAAIRETIEETGLPVALSAPHDLQARLHRGEAFGSLLAEHGLSLDLGALVPFARWRPAFHQPRRFDTLFFLARAPDGDWPLVPQAGECESAEWLTAADVLRRIGAGQATAIFPTIRNLERLAQFGSFDEAVAHARAHPVETISPWVEEVNGEKWLRIPDHLGYPVTAERLTDAIRA
mgnify:CR=1 FL=1